MPTHPSAVPNIPTAVVKKKRGFLRGNKKAAQQAEEEEAAAVAAARAAAAGTTVEVHTVNEEAGSQVRVWVDGPTCCGDQQCFVARCGMHEAGSTEPPACCVHCMARGSRRGGCYPAHLWFLFKQRQRHPAPYPFPARARSL